MRSNDVLRKRPTALIVDDDDDTREMYTYFLSQAGLSTVTATNGLDALTKAIAIVPDIITLDLQLPLMDGIDLCRALKQRKVTHSIPLVAVTGWTSASDIEAARQSGCVLVLLKPCLPATLLGEIRRVLTLA